MNALPPDAALLLASRHWRIRGDISALPSYADQNFRIRGERGDYVLKIAHPEWSRMDLDLENQAMMRLAEREPDLGCPRVQYTEEGEHLLTLRLAGAQRHVRMLSFVPGATYADAIGKLPSTGREALHHSLGETVGRLTRALEGFTHPAADRAHDWNLMRLPSLQGEIAHIDDAQLRPIVQEGVETFTERLPRWRMELPITVLHNDANDLNVIVDERGGAPRVGAVIDFGDMCTSFRLAELAIACTYAMQHESEPLACAHAIVRGYLTRCPLRRPELEQLQTFILARLCHSVLMATRAHRKTPGNPFILVSQRGVRSLLRQLVKLDRDAIAGPFLEAEHD